MSDVFDSVFKSSFFPLDASFSSGFFSFQQNSNAMTAIRKRTMTLNKIQSHVKVFRRLSLLRFADFVPLIGLLLFSITVPLLVTFWLPETVGLVVDSSLTLHNGSLGSQGVVLDGDVHNGSFGLHAAIVDSGLQAGSFGSHDTGGGAMQHGIDARHIKATNVDIDGGPEKSIAEKIYYRCARRKQKRST